MVDAVFYYLLCGEYIARVNRENILWQINANRQNFPDFPIRVIPVGRLLRRSINSLVF